MGMKLLAGVFGAIVTTALIGGVTLSGSLGDSDLASAHSNDTENAMQTACERGDFEDMLSAMEDTLSEEDHEAMMEHMAEMHDEDAGHMHDDDMGHMHDDGDDMHDGDGMRDDDPGVMDGPSGGGMMGGTSGGGMMGDTSGGGMMGGSMR